jgi:hypothetical protein
MDTTIINKPVMLSTIDNPYNPFVDYEHWLAYDREKGYNTNEYLARIALTSNELSDQDQDEAMNEAIDKIVKLNVLGIYIKVNDEYIPRMNSSILN